MKLAQAVIAGSFCVVVAYAIGTAYVVLAGVTLVIALVAGVARHGWHRVEDVLAAIAVAVVWPTLLIAYVVYRIDSARTTKLAATSRPSEPGGACIEDLDHREGRDQS